MQDLKQDVESALSAANVQDVFNIHTMNSGVSISFPVAGQSAQIEPTWITGGYRVSVTSRQFPADARDVEQAVEIILKNVSGYLPR